MPTAREVFRSRRFQEEVDRLIPELPRAEEALRGFSHVVARSPQLGMAVRGHPSYLQRPIHLPEDRSFTILYTYDESSVTLLGLKEVPSRTF